MQRRDFLIGASALALTAGSASARFPHGTAPSALGIFPLLLGGGGQTTNIDFPTASSPMLITQDTGGALKWNTGTLQWDQLINTVSMPATDAGEALYLNGCYGCVSAPSDPTRIYLLYGAGQDFVPTYLFISNDGGATFTRTAAQTGSPPISCDPNASNVAPSYKFSGAKMAVDPNNKDVLVFGVEPAGAGPTAFMTRDAGATLIDLSARGLAKSTGGRPTIGWAFDGSTTIWCHSTGSGIYKSTNSGTSFSLISGSPTNVAWGKLSPLDGRYWATQTDLNKIWRVTGTTAEDVTNGALNPQIAGTAYNLITSPFDATHVAIVNQSGPLLWSTNATAAAASVAFSGTTGFSGTNAIATDVPWLAMGGNVGSFTVGNMVMDPTTAGKNWMTSGTGVWYSTTASGSMLYTSQSKGLAQLISTSICSPPGGHPLMTFWDRPLFVINNPDVYPSNYQPNPNTEPVTFGGACDWASFDPTFQVAMAQGNNAVTDQSCFSTDNGATWTVFSAARNWPTTNFQGGSIAASTATNIIFAWKNNGDMYQTKDGGVTAWTKVLASNFQTSGGGATGMINAPGTVGWGNNFENVGRRVAADRVTADTFFCYNNNSGATGGGFYFTSNKGDLWTRMISGSLGTQTENELLFTVPNLANSHSTAGHFFYSDGYHGTGLWCSFSGVSTTSMIAVLNVGEVHYYGFGAVKPGNDYPSVYLIGKIGGVYGIWRSDASFAQWQNSGSVAVSWTKLTTFPLNSTDRMITITGDSNTYGKFYIGGDNQAYYGQS